MFNFIFNKSSIHIICCCFLNSNNKQHTNCNLLFKSEGNLFVSPRHNFMLEVHHISLFDEKPYYRGAASYNCLPEGIKRLKDITDRLAFKKIHLHHPHVFDRTQLKFNLKV